ncbi:MAG TPA: hypothetical protein PK728_09515 [Bacillota bacterium]|nr:hypothetical protein [Bacillota bacterium]
MSKTAYRNAAGNRIVSKRLKGLMVEHDASLRELARITGAPEKSLMAKIDGQKKWLFRELLAIIKYFNYTEVKEVFPELYNSA